MTIPSGISAQLEQLGDIIGTGYSWWGMKGCTVKARLAVECEHRGHYASACRFSGDDWSETNPLRDYGDYSGEYMYQQGWIPSYDETVFEYHDLPEIIKSPPELEQGDAPLFLVPDSLQYHTEAEKWNYYPVAGAEVRTDQVLPGLYRDEIGWGCFKFWKVHLPGSAYQEVWFHPELYASVARSVWYKAGYRPLGDGYPAPLVAAAGLLGGCAFAAGLSSMALGVNMPMHSSKLNVAIQAARKRKET